MHEITRYLHTYILLYYSYTGHTTTRHRTTSLWIEEYGTRYSYAARNYILRKPRQINYCLTNDMLVTSYLYTYLLLNV
jgi:hypothetical protein